MKLKLIFKKNSNSFIQPIPSLLSERAVRSTVSQSSYGGQGGKERGEGEFFSIFHWSVSFILVCLYYLRKKKKTIQKWCKLHPFAPKSWKRWWSPITWPRTCPQTKTNKLICHTNCLRFIKKQNCISRCWQLRPSLHGRRGHSLTCLCMLGGPSRRFPLGARSLSSQMTQEVILKFYLPLMWNSDLELSFAWSTL